MTTNTNLETLRHLVHAQDLDVAQIAKFTSTPVDAAYVAEHLKDRRWLTRITARRLARLLVEKLNALPSTRGRVRLLTEEDLEEFAKMIVDALKGVKGTNVHTIRATLVADYVPNSYRQTPVADVATVELDVAAFGGVVQLKTAKVERGNTQRRNRGVGDRAIVRAISPGQTLGAIVKKGMYQ